MFRYLNFCFFFTSIFATTEYNYYELAVQKWCSNQYMIHGLWPQYNETSYPEYCTKVNYTVPHGNLLISMNKYWLGCDNTLWEHEWTKHGSCMFLQNNIDEYSFFNTTIDLFLKHKKLTNKCQYDNCILACFDLNYNIINCSLKNN